jgi:hypothetical protein
MGGEAKRSDLSKLITEYNRIRTAVTFTNGAAGGTGTLTVNVANLSSVVPEKVTITSLKAGITDLFTKFSANCDCTANPQCNQTCQVTTCQTQCTITGNQAQCNATTDQGCQTTTCQSQCSIPNQGQCSTGNQGQCTCMTNQRNQGQCK